MVAKVSIDDSTLQQLQENGELHVQDSHGVSIVLMTLGARQQLDKIFYDDNELSSTEMLGTLSRELEDKENWGHPDMDAYDQKYGHLFDDDNGKNQ